uniref:Cytochrome P450 n=1 Tax=Amphimedon queenslandica TaxID=400682 RepID=A0A1X7V6F4_AMPQE
MYYTSVLLLPGGCGILIPIQMLHRSVEHWEQPEFFRPERFESSICIYWMSCVFIMTGLVLMRSHVILCVIMPFGAGPRNCVGMRFALMETKMCLMTLLRKYKFEREPDTQATDHF